MIITPVPGQPPTANQPIFLFFFFLILYFIENEILFIKGSRCLVIDPSRCACIRYEVFAFLSGITAIFLFYLFIYTYF